MRIGIIGAGMIGSTLAKLWVEADHQLLLSSRHPNELEALVKELGPLATAGTPADAAEFGDAMLLTVPLKAIPELARELAGPLAGRIVLDTGNAYEQRDGQVAREAMRDPRGTAAWAAAKFPGCLWVKAFNTVYYKTLANEARRDGDRVGIPIAGDYRDALEVASRLVRDAGFEPVVVGDLGRGKEFEPGTRVYNTGMPATELRKVFAKHAPSSKSAEPPSATA